MNKLFDIRERTFSKGQVCLYTWGHGRADFGDIEVKTLRNEGIVAQLNSNQLSMNVSPENQLDLGKLKSDVLAALDPDVIIKKRTFNLIQQGEETIPNEVSVKPLQVKPEIPFPLASRLSKVTPELMLPGVADIPQDSVILLEPNQSFIASFMVGVNHEMSRELLWRGLNADLRTTVFRQFWDVRGGNSTQKDIKPIDEWADIPLADQVQIGNASEYTVFLVKSQLMGLFPNAYFYLVEGVSDGKGARKVGTSPPQLLEFRVNLGDEISYFGFALSPEKITGQDSPFGWYFAIEQPTFGLRFGLNAERLTQEFKDWTDIAWTDFDANDAYISVVNSNPTPQTTNGINWGQDSAHMAFISQRKPFRIYIHGSQLLLRT